MQFLYTKSVFTASFYHVLIDVSFYKHKVVVLSANTMKIRNDIIQLQHHCLLTYTHLHKHKIKNKKYNIGLKRFKTFQNRSAYKFINSEVTVKERLYYE